MNSSRLIKPKPPENGFTSFTRSIRGPNFLTGGLGVGVEHRHRRIDDEIKEELRTYSLSQVEELVKDHLDMVQNARVRNKSDHGMLVSTAILIQMLIAAGIRSNLLSRSQILQIPRHSIGIHFKPSKTPVQELVIILGILIRLLFDEARQKRTTLVDDDAGQNVKDTWKISFNLEEFERRVETFFQSDSRKLL